MEKLTVEQLLAGANPSVREVDVPGVGVIDIHDISLDGFERFMSESASVADDKAVDNTAKWALKLLRGEDFEPSKSDIQQFKKAITFRQAKAIVSQITNFGDGDVVSEAGKP